MDRDRLARFIEFFLVGVLMGVAEDAIVVVFATDEQFTPQLLGIIVLVAIPVAILSELVVDRPEFEYFERAADRLAVILGGR